MKKLNSLSGLLSLDSITIQETDRRIERDQLTHSWETLIKNKDFQNIMEYAFDVYHPAVLHDNIKYKDIRARDGISDKPNLLGLEEFITHLNSEMRENNQ